MFHSNPKQLLTDIVTHYATVIHRQRKLYTNLAGLACEGRLNTRHEYVFMLVAALSKPPPRSKSGWESFSYLDPAIVAGPANFAGMFNCAASNKLLSFQKTGIKADVDADILSIDAFAPTGLVTHSIATALGERAVSHLNDLFSGDEPGELISLSALLLPPKGAVVQLESAVGVLPSNSDDHMPGGRVH